MDFLDYTEFDEGDDFFDADVAVQGSYIRLMHAAPKAPAVDIYVNNRVYKRNVRFGQVTEYDELRPGVYNIKVYAAGTTQNPVINSNFTLPPNSDFTIAVIPMGERLRLFPVRDPSRFMMPGFGYLRVVNFSPDAGDIDVLLRRGRESFKNVSYTEVTGYEAVRPGNYTVDILDSETEKLILNAPNQRISPRRLQTIYVIGLRVGTPSLRIINTIDAGSYM